MGILSLCLSFISSRTFADAQAGQVTPQEPEPQAESIQDLQAFYQAGNVSSAQHDLYDSHLSEFCRLNWERRQLLDQRLQQVYGSFESAIQEGARGQKAPGTFCSPEEVQRNLPFLRRTDGSTEIVFPG